MPVTNAQIQSAKAIQDTAAHDSSAQVRLVAGPGTGKSFSIEERVCWLLRQGVQPGTAAVVSFTRASSRELRDRVQAYCLTQNQAGGDQVRVSTLHSLALGILRAAGLLQYPADPLVLDNWELENIFDAEFGDAQNLGKKRREEIRREHEAFWSTGVWMPPNYIPPDPPISQAERTAFITFHGPRTQLYSCVLPGEIVRQCLQQILAGNLDPVTLINLQHLIVDEFQDLNPIDQQFVDELIARGVVTFVAGDDDQSIYSFRYASPSGIQNFVVKYPNAQSHTLSDCFRCTSTVVAAAGALMSGFASPNRIPKALQSLYLSAAPPVAGAVKRWRFNSAFAEATAIAQSCNALISAGMNPRRILVLLSNQRELLPALESAMAAAGVAIEPPRADSFIDSKHGRFVLALLRIVCEPNDYIAHRLLLGLRRGVGVGTCDAIANLVLNNGLNYLDVFYNPLPSNVFVGRALTAINNARQVCAQISTWSINDTLTVRSNDISSLIAAAFTAGEAQQWQTYAQTLPVGIEFGELRNWLWADNDEQQADVLMGVYQRLNQPIPASGVLPARVRIMTMHSAKGLSAQVVFVPGLEEHIFPGPWRMPYPGLVLEAARLLYVSVTRARAACVLSHSSRRRFQGQIISTAPSRFTTALGGPFGPRSVGLQTAEVQQILNDVSLL
jgi:DNA helicase II / ATP-dependent DNA helicase PcrA